MDYCGSCDIAYEGRNCPLCEAKSEIRTLEERIKYLESEE